MSKEFKIRALGAYGSQSDYCDLTAFQITDSIVVDAGSLISSLKCKACKIEHIFVTHSHFDHIRDIPLLVDSFFEIQTKTINIYGTAQCIENLKKHIFNWDIWPDFSKISMIDSDEPAIRFVTISMGHKLYIDNISIEPIENNHCTGSCGYVIKKEDEGIMLTSDTYKCQSIWDRVNKDKDIKVVVTETSFPSSLGKLAESSKHLTPYLLSQELYNLKRSDIKIYVNHLKSNYMRMIKDEIEDLEYDINVLHNMEYISIK
jgi:cAMP phosphodiesterase